MNSAEMPLQMNVSDLNFDLKNPRLSEYSIDCNSTEADVIKVLWDVMDVRELVLSIEASGFFTHEPIIVTHEDGKNIVIEGNRRLAAVKLLLNRNLASELNVKIPDLSEPDRDAASATPDLKRLPRKCMAVPWIQTRQRSCQMEQLCQVAIHCRRPPQLQSILRRHS